MSRNKYEKIVLVILGLGDWAGLVPAQPQRRRVRRERPECFISRISVGTPIRSGGIGRVYGGGAGLGASKRLARRQLVRRWPTRSCVGSLVVLN